LNDNAFKRGSEYLQGAINLGVSPMFSDPRFLDLYADKGIKVTFGGFNERYNELGYPEVINRFHELEEKTSSNTNHQLIFYTGTTPPQEYMNIARLYHKLKSQFPGRVITRQDLIKAYYRTTLSNIDLSIYFSYPRDKIHPPLLVDDPSIRFNIINPPLSLTERQSKLALYYTAITRKRITDQYINYNDLKNELRQEMLEYYLENSHDLWGSQVYDHNFIPIK